MSDPKPPRPLTAAELEARLLDGVDDILEKAASADAPELPPPPADTASRLEDRVSAPEDVEDDDEVEEEVGEWGPQPTVRNQLANHPDTVRTVDTDTKVLNLSDPAHLAEYVRIRRGAESRQAPTIAITELEKQTWEGSWTVLISFSKIQYQQI